MNLRIIQLRYTYSHPVNTTDLKSAFCLFTDSYLYPNCEINDAPFCFQNFVVNLTCTINGKYFHTSTIRYHGYRGMLQVRQFKRCVHKIPENDIPLPPFKVLFNVGTVPEQLNRGLFIFRPTPFKIKTRIHKDGFDVTKELCQCLKLLLKRCWLIYN